MRGCFVALVPIANTCPGVTEAEIDTSSPPPVRAGPAMEEMGLEGHHGHSRSLLDNGDPPAEYPEADFARISRVLVPATLASFSVGSPGTELEFAL